MGSIKSVICPAPMGGEENSMREFLFGSSPPSLRMDLIRIAVWAPLMVILGVVMEHSWFVFIPFIALDGGDAGQASLLESPSFQGS
jgi:hypothetical protein